MRSSLNFFFPFIKCIKNFQTERKTRKKGEKSAEGKEERWITNEMDKKESIESSEMAKGEEHKKNKKKKLWGINFATQRVENVLMISQEFYFKFFYIFFFHLCCSFCASFWASFGWKFIPKEFLILFHFPLLFSALWGRGRVFFMVINIHWIGCAFSYAYLNNIFIFILARRKRKIPNAAEANDISQMINKFSWEIYFEI